MFIVNERPWEIRPRKHARRMSRCPQDYGIDLETVNIPRFLRGRACLLLDPLQLFPRKFVFDVTGIQR